MPSTSRDSSGPDRVRARLAGGGFPKEARLRGAKTIRPVLARGDVFPGRQVIVRRLANAEGHARLGMAAPRGYGGAVRRNRFRRLAREAFRAHAPELGAFDFFMTPRRGLAEPTLEGLTADLLRTRTARPAPPRVRR